MRTPCIIFPRQLKSRNFPTRGSDNAPSMALKAFIKPIAVAAYAKGLISRSIVKDKRKQLMLMPNRKNNKAVIASPMPGK